MKFQNLSTIMHLCFVPIPLLLVYLRMRISTLKQCWSVRGPLRECRSIWAGASGLPYYCAPLVCVSAELELLAVCCFVLLTPGWGRLETRSPVAQGSSPELSTFTMSLAPPVHPSLTRFDEVMWTWMFLLHWPKKQLRFNACIPV